MQNSGLEPSKSVAYFEYDFNKHGGAVGDIAVGGDVIPSGAVINMGAGRVKQAFTSGGAATVAAKAVSAEDIMTATAIASLTEDSVPWLMSDNILITENLTEIIITIAVADITAGKMVFCLEYVMTD